MNAVINGVHVTTQDITISAEGLRDRILALNSNLNRIQLAALDTAAFLTTRMAALCPTQDGHLSPARVQVIAQDLEDLESAWKQLDQKVCAEIRGLL